jgi:glucose dehydrogenase
MRSLWKTILIGPVLFPALFAQNSSVPPGDWPMFNRDLAGTRYSPLSQFRNQHLGMVHDCG